MLSRATPALSVTAGAPSESSCRSVLICITLCSIRRRDLQRDTLFLCLLKKAQLYPPSLFICYEMIIPHYVKKAKSRRITVRVKLMRESLSDLYNEKEIADPIRIRVGVFVDARQTADIEERFNRAMIAADKIKDDPQRICGFYDL